MRNSVLAGLAMVCITVVAGIVISAPKKFSEIESVNRTRGCVYPIGGWTKIDCSNAVAAQTGQLSQWARYVVQCFDDSYIATGDESSDTADANDGYLPEGAWLDFNTTDTVRYLSCLNKNEDSDCRYWECQ